MNTARQSRNQSFNWDTDEHGYTRIIAEGKTETKRQSYSSAIPGPIRLILTARQPQKSPLRPPFLKGGWGDFREAFPTQMCLTKFKDFAKQ